MTKVSRRHLDKELENYIFNIFIKSIADLDNQLDIKNFLDDLLSPTEKIMLIKRLAIAVLLTKGYTYDQIDHTLKVSRPTIMNVSYFLKHGKSGGYQKMANKVLNDQKKAAFFDKIEEILINLSPPKLYKSAAYDRKKKLGRELFIRKLLRDRS